MESVNAIITWLSDNYVLVIAMVLAAMGLVIKTVKFFRQSEEDQKAQLKAEVDNIIDYIKRCLESLVTEAELKYGSGTGQIKKSEVYQRLLQLIPSLEQYILDGDIAAEVIGELIDEAVSTLNKVAKKNQSVQEIFKSDDIIVEDGVLEVEE